jgi:hypothetical protein
MLQLLSAETLSIAVPAKLKSDVTFTCGRCGTRYWDESICKKPPPKFIEVCSYELVDPLNLASPVD